MKNLYTELSKVEFDSQVLSNEEGWMLTYKYVSHFYRTSQFSRLQGGFQLEDLVSEIYAKFLAKDLFAKYNPSVTTKKYHVMLSVKRSLIDISRKYREAFSLDKEVEEGTDFYNIMPSDEDIEVNVIDDEFTNLILDSLSDTTASKVKGNSPLLGEVEMTERTILYHLIKGYRVGEIAEFFINPKNGKPVSSSSISRIAREAKENAKINFNYLITK